MKDKGKKMRKILLSIKPVFAEQILRGEKRVEMRKKAKVMMGDVIHLYASSPEKKIVGEFIAGRTYYVQEEDAMEMISRRGDLGLDSRDKKYVAGGKYIQVIPVLFPRRYKRPISISEIRAVLPGFTPPVSYLILDRNEKLLGILEEKRCENEPTSRFIVFGVEGCVFCGKNVDLLKNLFGLRCVAYCDLHSRTCFLKYRSISKRVFNSKKGVPLTLGRYGKTFIAIRGGIDIYVLDRIYANIDQRNREMLIYKQGSVIKKKASSEDIELFDYVFG